MKRVHDGIEEDDTEEQVMRVRLGIDTRLGVLVPVDNIRQTAIPGLRSVYYCPRVFAGGSGIVIDGLVFELYLCADPALTDDMIHSSLLWGYLGTMKRSMGPDAPEGFPPTLFGDALALVADGEDEHLLEIESLSPSEANTLRVHVHKRFVDENCVTRLVRVRTRFHPLFVSIVDRLRNSDKLVRNRNDPQRRAEYNCLLLVPTLTGNKTRDGRWKGLPVSRLMPVVDAMAPLTQLADQLRLHIDELERLSSYERSRIAKNAIERAKRLAGADFQELDATAAGAEHHFDPRDLSGFKSGGGSQLFASIPYHMLAACHGTIVAPHIRMPRAMVEPVQETHRLLGTRPWLLEEDVSIDIPKMMINYALIRFQRSMVMESGANSLLTFKTPEQLLRELPPIITKPPARLQAKKNKKQKTEHSRTQSTLSSMTAPIPMRARMPVDPRSVVMSVHIKTE